MAAASWFKYAYLAHLSQPKGDRQLYRWIRRRGSCRVVEVGLVDVRRSARWIEVAQRFAGTQKVWYTGLDWFDARPAKLPAFSLKQAYRSLQPTGAAVRLVPGAPAASIGAVANAHPDTDLLWISHWIEPSELESAWFYLPRMIHAGSLVLREQLDEAGRRGFAAIPGAEIVQQAARHAHRPAA